MSAERDSVDNMAAHRGGRAAAGGPSRPVPFSRRRETAAPSIGGPTAGKEGRTMELELKKACFDAYEAAGELTLTQEETAETIVPEIGRAHV